MIRSVKIHEIITAMEAFAPLLLQESYDNAGLQVGTTDQDIHGVLVCLDITERVVDYAIEHGFNMVLSHHPLIFKALKQVSDRSYQQRCVGKAVKNDLVLYSAHTNLDNVEDGVNYRIARILGLADIEWLEPGDVIGGHSSGSGIVGSLPEPVVAVEFLREVKDLFHVGCLMHTDAEGRTVSKVALCGGAGSFLMDRAAAAGADCFLTGEISYHHFFENEGMILAALGHFQSEQFTIDLMSDYLKKLFPAIRVEKLPFSTDPILYM